MSARRPPAWARALARLLVWGSEREFILGDLEETYARAGGGLRAAIRYLMSSVGSALYEARGPAFGGVRTDVRLALRQLRRQPRVFVGGALVLAVGLGIATATWGVHHGVFGRSLPVSDPDRIVELVTVDRTTHQVADLSIADVDAIRASVSGLDAVGLWGGAPANLTDGDGAPERVDTDFASADLFRLLEFTPLYGRTLLRSDDEPGSPPVAVLGFRFWTARYGADPSIVGRTVRLGSEPTLVVGVLPPGVGLTGEETFWRSMGSRGDRDARDYYALARLGPGSSRPAVSRQLDALAARLGASGDPAWRETTLRAGGFMETIYRGVSSIRDRVLSLGGFLLFVMALANVANLFLVHARVRSRELTVRRALGAGRLRILRQLSVEAAVPALLGFMGAVAVAGWALRWYQNATDAYGVGFLWQVYRLEAPHVLRIAIGALASTVFVSVVAGTRAWLGEGYALRGPTRGEVSSTFRLGRVLLGVEVALGASLFLLASLMIRSAWNLRTIDFGFTTASVMTGDVMLSGADYDERAERTAFWNRLEESLSGLDGVRAAAVGTQLPMTRCCGSTYHIEVEGWDVSDSEDLPVHYVDAVSPTYFDTFERSILRGRGIAVADGPGAEPIIVVNEPFVARYFAGQDPLGHRLRIWRAGEPGPWRTVVGVAANLWMDTDENAHPEGTYVPLADFAPVEASFAIRVAGPPEAYAEAIRATVMRLDPELPVTEVQTMPHLIRDRTSLYRREGPIFTLLGVAALVLAIVGLYAVVSYLASLRTAELGLRSALGATRPDLVIRSVAQATTPTMVGAVVGLAVGLRLTRGFDRYVFLVDPGSPWMVVATALVLFGSALGASLLPALRASRVDPVRVLRTE